MGKVNAILEKMIRVPKALLSRADFRILQKDLTVSQKSFADEDKPIRVYTEGTNSIWLPRWYGHHFLWERGIEAVDRRSDGFPMNAVCTAKLGHGKFPSQQPLFVDAVLQGVRKNGFGGFGVAPCGCHARGALILMADGTQKRAEDVVVGDFLMGIDGPRCVLELHRGRQRMARVVPRKGRSFTVNVGHALTVLWSVGDGARKDGEVIDISVAEWLLASKNFQRHTVLYRPRVDKFFTGYTDRDRPIRPYHLGMLLGDGNLHACGVTTDDSEVVREVHRLASEFGLNARKDDSGGTRCSTYYISTGIRFFGCNALSLALKGLGLFGKKSGSKFIPRQYLTAARRDRLDLLAGLLDTDGHMTCGGFDWISKSLRLANGMLFLCRSLGLAAYMKPCKKYDQNGHGGTYYRVSISGDCSVIPTRVARKKAPSRRINKDAQRVGFTVTLLPEDDYYGFVVDGDHRYLMGDFTWTHNTGKTVMGAAVAAALGRSTLILVHKGFLMRQWKEALRLFVRVDGKPPMVGTVREDVCQFGKDVPFAVGMIQSLASRDYPKEFYEAWGVILLDEVQHVPARTWLEVVGRLSARYTIGLTATLRRKDGLQPIFEHTLGPVHFTLNRDDVKADVVYFGIHFLGSTKYFYSAGGINRSKLEKRLANIVSRNEVIAGEIVKAVESGRKRIIVLTGTRIHLSRLYKLLPIPLKRQAGFYVGGRKEEQLAKVEGRTIILATYGMAEEGLDIGDLDCIMLATPRPDVEQPVGRAFRFYVPKFKPLIVDFVDRIPGLVKWALRREEQYKRLGVTLRNKIPASRY